MTKEPWEEFLDQDMMTETVENLSLSTAKTLLEKIRTLRTAAYEQGYVEGRELAKLSLYTEEDVLRERKEAADEVAQNGTKVAYEQGKREAAQSILEEAKKVTVVGDNKSEEYAKLVPLADLEHIITSFLKET